MKFTGKILNSSVTINPTMFDKYLLCTNLFFLLMWLSDILVLVLRELYLMTY